MKSCVRRHSWHSYHNHHGMHSIKLFNESVLFLRVILQVVLLLFREFFLVEFVNVYRQIFHTCLRRAPVNDTSLKVL